MEEDIWKALALGGTLAGLAYVFADVATQGSFSIVAVGAYVAVFLAVYFGTYIWSRNRE